MVLAHCHADVLGFTGRLNPARMCRRPVMKADSRTQRREGLLSAVCANQAYGLRAIKLLPTRNH